MNDWEKYLAEHSEFKLYKPQRLPIAYRRDIAEQYAAGFPKITLVKGRVVATMEIPAATLFGEHMGTVVNLANLPRSRTRNTTFFVRLDDNIAIDGNPRIRDAATKDFRKKAKVQFLRDGGAAANAHYFVRNGRILLIANKPIAPGEEVTIDYSMPFANRFFQREHNLEVFSNPSSSFS